MNKRLKKIIFASFFSSFLMMANATTEVKKDINLPAPASGVPADVTKSSDFSSPVVSNLKKQIEKDKNNPKLYFELSKEYGALKMGNEAFEAINEALKRDPKNIAYLLQKAAVANWLKKPKVMEENYRRAYALDSSNQEAALGLARANVQLNKLQEADKLFQSYLEKNPDDKEVILEYINVQIWMKHLEKAKQLLADYKSRFGESEKYQETMKQLENASIKPTSRGAVLKGSAPSSAVENLKQKIAEDKNNPNLYFELSKEYGALKMGNEAFKAINEALKLDPKNVTYLLHRAAVANWLKKPKIVEESYKRAHELDPSNPEAILGLARVDVSLKKLPEASQLFQNYLEKNPDNKEVILEYINVQIWMKNIEKAKQLLANYKSRFGDSPKYQESLKQLQGATSKPGVKIKGVKVVKNGPKNASYYAGLSQNYAAKKQAKEALIAINQALAFEPNNIQYLKTQASLASWANNLPLMEESYSKILKIDFNNSDAILGMARACSWQGKTKCAIVNYKRYLTMHPASEEALIEYSDVKIQMEAYRDARALLFTDRAYHGETKRYKAQIAKLYAVAKWYDSAAYYNSSLLSEEPNNFNYLLTDAYTKFASRTHAASLEVLKQLHIVKPDAAETRFLDLYLRRPVRSYITIDELGLGDTHTVRLSETSAHGYVYFNPATAFHFTGLYEYASATDLQYTPVFGGQSIHDISGKVGLFHRFSKYFEAEANIGSLSIQNVNSYFIGNFTGKWSVNERMWLSYRYSHDLFRPDIYTVFSPRSISLGIMEDDNVLRLHLEPALQRYVDIVLEYNIISDGNHLRHANIWPNLRLLSVPGWTVNAGLMGDLYSFTNPALNDGYYNPSLAQTYLATMTAYHGFSLNNGISLSGGIGMQKDNTFQGLEPAADMSVDLMLGVFKDWQFEAIGAYSYRGNPIRSYKVLTGKVALTRRF